MILSQDDKAEFLEIRYPEEVASLNIMNMTLIYDCKSDMWIAKNEYERPIVVYSFSTKVVDGWLTGFSLTTFYTAVVIVVASGLKYTVFFFWTYAAHHYEMNEP